MTISAFPGLPGTVPPASATSGAAAGVPAPGCGDGFAALVAQLVAGGAVPSPAPVVAGHTAAADPVAVGQDDADDGTQGPATPDGGPDTGSTAATSVATTGAVGASGLTATLVAPTVLTGLPVVPVVPLVPASAAAPTPVASTSTTVTPTAAPALPGAPATTPPVEAAAGPTTGTPTTEVPDTATASAVSGTPDTTSGATPGATAGPTTPTSTPTSTPTTAPAAGPHTAAAGQQISLPAGFEVVPAAGTSTSAPADGSQPPASVVDQQPGAGTGTQTGGQADGQQAPAAQPSTPAGAPTATGGVNAPTPVTALQPTVLPTGAPEASPVPGGAVTRQVLPEVSRLVSRGNGTHRVTLTLQPEQLGEVRVTLTVRQGEVHVSLAAGEDARRALAEGAPELRRVLELAGATDTRVVVRDLAGSTTAASTAATAPSPYGDAAGGARGDARGDTAAPGHGRGGTPDQHAGTRGGTTARDGVTDGTEHRSRPEPVRPARSAGVDLTM